MSHFPDGDPSDDLEARLRAWRPAALPRALHARLLAAEPPPRKLAARGRSLSAAGALMLASALIVGWWTGGGTDPVGGTGSARLATRRTPETGQWMDAAWTPGASLTMNLATGTPVGNVPAPWRLDDDPGSETGLFALPSADGKLLLKVDCQF